MRLLIKKTGTLLVLPELKNETLTEDQSNNF